MIYNKKQYILDRYYEKTNKDQKLFNGFHIQKEKRVAKPFSSFYPDPNCIKKNPLIVNVSGFFFDILIYITRL